MKNFLIKLSGFLLIVILYFCIDAGFFIITWKKVPEKQAAIKAIRGPQNNEAGTLSVIGCSNLQHNIDMPGVKKAFQDRNVNFYYYSAALNSSYIKFLLTNLTPKDKSNILLYMPYEMYRASNTFADKDYFYQYAISKSYLKFLIRDNPYVIWGENWIDIYRKVSKQKYTASSENTQSDDSYMDSLNNPATEYSSCTNKFVHEKHIVGLPDYRKKDGDFLNELYSKPNYNILLSPVPNIKEHTSLTDNACKQMFINNGIKVPINEYHTVIYDSALFFDQWFHLNKCGNKIATQDMIAAIHKIPVHTTK